MKRFACFSCATLAVSVFASEAPVAKLVTVNGMKAVRIGSKTMRLGRQPDPDAGGQFDAIRSADGVGRIDPKPFFLSWLKDDDRWGGHDAANQLRYMNRNGGGIGVSLGSFYRFTGGVTYAIMSLQYLGPSGAPTGPQVLVRQPSGQSDLVWVRLLTGLPQILYRTPPPRIYTIGANPYVLESGGLYGLNIDGTPGRKFADVPPMAIPRGVAAGRFLIFSGADALGWQWIQALDFARRQCFVVMRIPPYRGDGPQPPYFDDGAIGDSPYLMFSGQEPGQSGKNYYFDVHLPDASRRSLPTDMRPLGDYGVAEEGGAVRIYRLKTGKKVQTLSLG